MGLFRFIYELNNFVNEREDKKKKQNLDKKMKMYDLDEHEKKLVNKGEYDPWDFDTDGDLNENDYYYYDKK